MRRIFYLFLLLATMVKAQQPQVLADEFIYEEAPFPSCHASTIVELQNGDLLSAWFGGKYEGSPDVCIWTARKLFGASRWSTPQLAAEGFEQKACYNPVLFQMPDGEVLLFFKIGAFVQDWTGWLVRSQDNGYTWTEKESLPEGFLGPVKNKPELIALPSSSILLCPSSTEKGGWKIHFEIIKTDSNGHFPSAADLAKQSTVIGPVEAELAEKTFEQGTLSPIGCIQPSILRLKDGRLQVLCRTQNGRLATSFSSDDGRSWSKVTLTDLPNNNSGTDAVTLHDGRHVLVSNPVATPTGENGGKRSPLTVSISEDGQTWQHISTLADDNEGEYSYPAVIEGRDGSLHILYTWRRQRIRYVHLSTPVLQGS